MLDSKLSSPRVPQKMCLAHTHSSEVQISDKIRESVVSVQQAGLVRYVLCLPD